tara:strand:- start:8324 stop:8779 length:456 start_codon:yes stop_codon:yes gene_type:complete
MNTKVFVKILRKVVREEVQTAVKQILGEQSSSHKSVIDQGISLHDMVEQQEVPYKKKAYKKTKFSKNKMLDDILNETAMTGNFNNMNEGPMVGQESFASVMGTSRGINTIPTTDVEGRQVNMAALPEHLTSALTKDYSAIMKAIDKKKGGR